MANAGDDIAYDVCVAYALDDQPAAAQLRDWSAKLVATLRDVLSPRDFSQGPAPRFFAPQPGAIDWEALRAASGRSALLFVIVSPGFCESPGAIAVMKTFAAATAARGGTLDSIVAITAYPMPAGFAGDAVMMQIASTGEARRGDFYDDKAKEPIEYALGAKGSGPFKTLVQPIRELAFDITCKLRDAARLLVSAPAVVEPRVPETAEAERPEAAVQDLRQPDQADPGPAVAKEITVQLYLRDHGDKTVWTQTRTALSKVAIVSPQFFASQPPAIGLKERLAEREKRIDALLTCNAMALLRTSATSEMSDAVKTALWDLNFIRQKSDPEFAWFLVDWIGEPPPDLPDGLVLPRVFPANDDFARQVTIAMAPR